MSNDSLSNEVPNEHRFHAVYLLYFDDNFKFLDNTHPSHKGTSSQLCLQFDMYYSLAAHFPGIVKMFSKLPIQSYRNIS